MRPAQIQGTQILSVQLEQAFHHDAPQAASFSRVTDDMKANMTDGLVVCTAHGWQSVDSFSSDMKVEGRMSPTIFLTRLTLGAMRLHSG